MRSKGFSLVEMLLVAAILGIIFAAIKGRNSEPLIKCQKGHTWHRIGEIWIKDTPERECE